MGERGLVVDRDVLIAHLENVGYYRLSGYWYIFKRKPEADEDGCKHDLPLYWILVNLMDLGASPTRCARTTCSAS